MLFQNSQETPKFSKNRCRIRHFQFFRGNTKGTPNQYHHAARFKKPIRNFQFHTGILKPIHLLLPPQEDRKLNDYNFLKRAL